MGLLIGAAFWIRQQDQADTVSLMMLCFVALLVALVTVVQIVVYDASALVLTEQGITVTNWTTLFSSKQATCDWEQIEDISVEQAGFVAGLFGFGTLLVQTAGTQTNFRLTYVPRVTYWRDYIDKRS